MLVAVRQHLGDIQELLVAHVAFAAAEEDVGTLLPLHALVTVEHNGILTCAYVADLFGTCSSHILPCCTFKGSLFLDKML